MEDDDLTASHWDDVLSPHSGSTFNVRNTPVPPVLGNEFSDLADKHEEDEEDKEEEEAGSKASGGADPVGESQREQLKDIEEKRKENLISRLTDGVEEVSLGSGIDVSERVKPSESLFKEKDSPIKASLPAVDTNLSSPGGPKTKNGLYKPSRIRKYSSKVIVKHLGDDITDNAVLGPLGDSNDDGMSDSNKEAGSLSSKNAILEAHNAPLYGDNKFLRSDRRQSDEKNQRTRARGDTGGSGEPREKIFLPELEVSIGDPMKVGDITNAHIVYSIKTKVRNPESTLLPNSSEQYVVTRRYKDFRWIYHQLQNNHPGRIIPPPPIKQTYIGRFNENFVENRRISLERMLNKICQNEALYNDHDFIMFLTSENFITESKERELASGSGASTRDDAYLDNDKNGVQSTESNVSIVPGGSGGGFMSSIFSMSMKVSEPDEYFIEKKDYIESLETNLKLFHKSIELIGTQRADLVTLVDEVSLVVDELANIEMLKSTSNLLAAFSEVELKIKDNLDRVHLQEQLSLGFTIEEYLRVIGSIKFVFETRENVYQQYYNCQQEFQKKLSQLSKLNKKFKVLNDKISLLNFEIDKLKQKVQCFEKSFNSISDTIKDELERFEFEKIDDFRNSVEIFIESSIESQKEAIEVWETFYERQELANV